MNLQFVTRAAFKAFTVAKKFAPDAMTIGASIGVVATAVTSARATLKVHNYLSEHGETIVEELESDTSAKKQLAVVKKHSAGIVKPYLLPAALGVSTIGCVIGAHSIMANRLTAATSALTILQEKLDKAMENVDTDAQIKKAKTQEDLDNVLLPAATAIFDDQSTLWRKTAGGNLMTLESVQTFMNDRLRTKGIVFLNEVLDQLDLPRTKYGQLVGWVYGTGDSHDFIDFGLDSALNQRNKELNGENWDRYVYLTFNVDGLVYDLI